MQNKNNPITEIQYIVDDLKLETSVFLELVAKVWPNAYAQHKVEAALASTQNITAWQEKRLIGCVRLLTDGYFFSTITEILVDPAFQGKGVGTHLMQLVWELSPSSLAFGVQPGNEAFFEKLGYKAGLSTYQKLKQRT